MVERVPVFSEPALLERKLGSLEAVRVAVRNKESVALGHESSLVILRVRRGKVELQPVDDEELRHDSLTSLQCIGATGDDSFFCVGFASGWIRWYQSDGHLCMSNRLHDSPVMHIKQGAGRVAVLFEGGVLALLDSTSLFEALQSASPGVRHGPLAGVGDGAASVSYHKYELDGQRVVNDVIPCAGSPVPDPWSLYHVKPCKVQLLGAGAFPMLGTYVPSESHGALSSAVALASELTSKLTSAVFGMAKSWWSSGNDGPNSPQKSAGSAQAAGAKIEDPHSLNVTWALNDSNRDIHTISAAPTAAGHGGLAAACDKFGRVMLLDLKLQIVARMWKGYRDAQVGWILSTGSLFLVIHAPRRGVLEVWRMRHGQREAILDVGMGCQLVRGVEEGCCYLLLSNGTLQRIQFNLELAQHLKRDEATLEKIRERKEDIIPLIRQMVHPKLLVQAILALSKNDPSSLFVEAVNAALEQCASDEKLPILTPGAASKVVTQDATHLVWLDRYIRAYRALEMGEAGGNEEEESSSQDEVDKNDGAVCKFANDLSCREFLWCFTVRGASEARLTAGITVEKRLQLAKLLFAEGRLGRFRRALQLTRLARADAELLFADCILSNDEQEAVIPLDREAAFIKSLTTSRGPLLRESQDEALLDTRETCKLPILLERVSKSTALKPSLELSKRVLESFPDEEKWQKIVTQLETLVKISNVAAVQTTVQDALNGVFSLFTLIASVEQDSDVTARLQKDFAKHFEQKRALEAHRCLRVLGDWEAEFTVEKDLALPATPLRGGSVAGTEEDHNDSDEDDDWEEEDPALLETNQARLLLSSVGLVSENAPLLALYAWQKHYGPLFWKSAALVDLARRTPSENVVRKTLSFSNMAEFRQFCSAARDMLHTLLGVWKEKTPATRLTDQVESNVPFPCRAAAALYEAEELWASRNEELRKDFEHTLFLARTICLVLKYGIRSVVVGSVLPESSKLRDHLQSGEAKTTAAKGPAAGRFNSVSFQRRELILKLLPANNKLAISYAKALDVDLDSVRKMAAQPELY